MSTHSRLTTTYSAQDLNYPPQLPVTGEREAIIDAIRDHQVVIVAGETGSGKTTQLPKMCLELGLHRDGLIGHTQPRRLAARTVAERLAEELGTSLGETVGYQVRFTSEVSGDSAVKLMTDGILLAEIRRDPLLRKYSAIIIDEAHERSLTIDVILGYLKRILPQRPDLKVIITSATIEPARFAQHFGNRPAADSSSDVPRSTSARSDRSGTTEHSAEESAEGSAEEAGPAGEDGEAPIIEVSGRTYPVEIRYRPVIDDELDEDELDPDSTSDPSPGSPAGASAASSRASASSRPATSRSGSASPGRQRGEGRDMMDAVGDAVVELADEPTGDMLIFFPGEREIRDAAEELRGLTARHRRLQDAEILPLFGRLSMQEQKRVFSPGGRRRIILATNVAETSLTVPGIKYVIDTGTARISRYSTRTKVQRLPIERISQASANQRSGRCGRTSDGIAIRLYSEEDFRSRPEFTDPEILRTSLASVLLQMSSMGITETPEELLDFPFVQPPDAKAVNDAVRLLGELGALHTRSEPQSASQHARPSKGARKGARKGPRPAQRGHITDVGRTLAQLPVDPRLGRMMVEADRRKCLTEVTVLVAALSIQDPRERPSEERQRADELHGRFKDENSDFSALLNLWHYLQEKHHELSGNQFRKMCHREYLNYLRIREWQDLVQQLSEIARNAELGGATTGQQKKARGRRMPTVDAAGRHDSIHQSLLSGLLSHIGVFTPKTRDYQGARGTRFAVFPGSHLFKKNHDWVMAAELVETSRLWARTVARIDPSWVEDLAPQLVKTSHSEPRWSASRGAVIATERVTLFGLPIVADRQVLFGKIDPEYSREIFIHRALIEGDWRTRHHFDARNRQRFTDLEEWENRTRRKNLRASDEELFAFFDARVPTSVVSQKHFDAWWKTQRHETPELLDLTEDQLFAEEANDVDTAAYPEVLDHDGLELELRYEFNPSMHRSAEGPGGRQGASRSSDGVTVRVPLIFLNQLEPERFEWLIPGLRQELVTHMIRSLPKQLRKNFVPAPDVATRALTKIGEPEPGTSLRVELASALQSLTGVPVDSGVFDLSALPAHLRFTFAVVSDRGRVLDTGTDLVELQIRFSAQTREAIGRSISQGSGSPSAKSAAHSNRSAKPEPAGPGQADGSAGPSGHAAAAGQVGASGSASISGVTELRHQRQWTFGDLPASVSSQVNGRDVTGYPALARDAANGDAATASAPAGVRVEIQDSPDAQHRVHRQGIVELLRCVLPSPQRYVMDHLSNRERLAFGNWPHGTVESLVADCTQAALDHMVPDELPFSAAAFEGLARTARADLIETVLRLTDIVAETLTRATAVRRALDSATSAALQTARHDMEADLENLVHNGFVTAAGFRHLQHVPRYLQGMQERLERLTAGKSLSKDSADTAEIQQLEDEYDAAVESIPAQLPVPRDLLEVRWMLQEYRIALFAQRLGTAQTVSPKRIRRAIKLGTRS